MSVIDSSRTGFDRGFITLFLLVAFLLIAFILPRILLIGPGTNRFSIYIGMVSVEYRWSEQGSLVLNISNWYDEPIYLEKLVIGDREYVLNGSRIEPRSSILVNVDRIKINRSCYARLYYRLSDRTFKYLFVLTPCRNSLD